MGNKDVLRYAFKSSIPAKEIEGTLFLAIVAAEGLYGSARVRIDGAYCFSPKRRVCVIDAGSDVGRDICRMFTGFAIREYGEKAFKVRWAEPKSERLYARARARGKQ